MANSPSRGLRKGLPEEIDCDHASTVDNRCDEKAVCDSTWNFGNCILSRLRAGERRHWQRQGSVAGEIRWPLLSPPLGHPPEPLGDDDGLREGHRPDALAQREGTTLQDFEARVRTRAEIHCIHRRTSGSLRRCVSAEGRPGATQSKHLGSAR